MTSEVPFNFHILSLQIYIQTQLVFQAEYPHKGACLLYTSDAADDNRLV